jgi:hypothetical protein
MGSQVLATLNPHFQSRSRQKPIILSIASVPNITAGCAGLLTGQRMAEWYRSVNWCLERAAHYEQKAERAVDPAARRSFLDAANRWRQSAEIYQSMNWGRADPSRESDKSERAQGPSLAQHVLGSLGSWSRWLGLNRAA